MEAFVKLWETLARNLDELRQFHETDRASPGAIAHIENAKALAELGIELARRLPGI